MPRTAKGRKTIKKKPIRSNKPCLFTQQKIEYIDYKDVEILRKFISSNTGKILPRRITGTSALYQRKLATAIKQSREVALLPFVVK